MNEANRAVRGSGAGRGCGNPCALGFEPQEMDSNFAEGAAGTAIELRLTRFAGAILEQANPSPSQF